MSLYGDYIKEREGFEIVETEHAFATFQIEGEHCYIRDIYVDKASRKDGVASQLADEISRRAKEKGCRILLGTVAAEANGSTESMKVLLAYGFKLMRSEDERIIFCKEL